MHNFLKFSHSKISGYTVYIRSGGRLQIHKHFSYISDFTQSFKRTTEQCSLMVIHVANSGANFVVHDD